ncbi:MAG: family 78 glycoside hydrolase catalytic domain [Clostridia bacterium]|nr:family 78 glycoside hydrolase catalytic domain [Clostridia bacterium]MBR6646692.1 family 78 glycoside hydrolase catalytic domain [Clostridia bacterium]
MDRQWKAKWISSKDYVDIKPRNIYGRELPPDFNPAAPVWNHTPQHDISLKNDHILVRKVFNVDKVENAKLYISADDNYRLYINGKKIGLGPASNYYFHYFYNTYDISEYLNEGENIIAVHVFYAGTVDTRAFDSGDFRQGMIAEIVNGGEVIAATDDTWKYTHALWYHEKSPMRWEIQFKENTDFRLKDTKWMLLDYDDSSWENMCIKEDDDHDLYNQFTPIKEVYEASPVICEKRGDKYFIDFGREITGSIKFSAMGARGDKVIIRHAEELKDDGSLMYVMRCEIDYEEEMILSGGYDTFEPYDYKGFRYAEIEDNGGGVIPESIVAEVCHYPLDEENCDFKCKDTLVQAIWDICYNALRCGTQDNFVDCPTREKGQYLGDGTLTGHTHMWMSMDTRMQKKAILQFALSGKFCPGLMSVAPGGLMQEIADYELELPICVKNYYDHTGDIEFVKEIIPALDILIDYYDDYKRPDGLLENVLEKWNIVDWPACFRDHYDAPLLHGTSNVCHNVLNAIYIGAVKLVEELKDIAGVKYKKRYDDLKKAFVNAFYDKEKGLFKDREESDHTALHSNAIPVYFGILPDDFDSSKMKEFFIKKRMSCSQYIAYFYLRALAKLDMHDFMYELMTCKDQNSWANMIKEGATACFEAWSKFTRARTSLCHPWGGTFIVFMIEEVMGIKPVAGFNKITFNPHLPANVPDMVLNLQSPAGDIHFKCKNGKATITADTGIEIV